MKEIPLKLHPKQALKVVQENGEVFQLLLEYSEVQQSWFLSVLKEEFAVHNLRLVVTPNILRKWKNIINFGIMVHSEDLFDPCFIEDFSSKRVQLYVLNEEEVADVEDVLFFSGIELQSLDFN